VTSILDRKPRAEKETWERNVMPTKELTKEYRKTNYAEVVERIEGCYEVQEVQCGVVYRWQPGYALVECSCGKMLTLTCLMATCSGCAADHTALVHEELAGQCSEDEALHPWHYAGDREGLGLPY